MAVANEESELPSEVEDQIEPNLKNDLRKKEVAEVFYETNRPYLETGQVRKRVDGEFSRGTVSSRLDDLVDAGVLRKDTTGNADQYWIANDHSHWMVPDDVVVISDDAPEAITWNDLLNDRLSRDLGWGVLSCAVSGISVTGLALIAGFVNTGGLLYTGLVILTGVALIGVLVGFALCILSLGKAALSDGDSELEKILPF